MRSWVLRSLLWVPKPPAAVFPYFADAANLGELTPAWLSFRILTPLPIAMAEDRLIDYRIRLHGVPMRWRTRIARWQPPHAFADEQLRGPYVRWFHLHGFTPRDGGTELTDRVELTLPGGVLAPLLFRLFVRRSLLAIFRHRLAVMAARFEGDGASGRVWFEHEAAPSAPVGGPYG